MKRIMCMMMALAMTLALCVPAFASNFTTKSGDNVGEITSTFTGATKTPTIKVLVPSNIANAQLVLNPYGLKFTESALVSGGGTAQIAAQVISKPTFIGSLSDVPLKINMKVVATPGNANVILASKSLKDDTKTTTKSVFLWGQVVGATAGADVPTTIPTFASEYDATAGKTGDMILVAAGTTGVTRTGIYTIPAVTNTANGQSANWACARFFGDAVKAPTNAWTNADKVDLAVTFSFTASMNESSS